MLATDRAGMTYCWCGSDYDCRWGVFKTCLGYPDSPTGHDHDGNAESRAYRCAHGHVTWLSRRRRCDAEGCSFVGMEHGRYPEVLEWPAARDNENMKELPCA